MPLTRNNNEKGKAFDIDTKIEYMNKLYEVRESKSCCDCSLATICSSSDISASDRNDDVLSRDKRINIFGECSSLRRLDRKSVVFVEIPKEHSKDTSKDEYYKFIPLWIDNNYIQLRPIEFDLPNGCEIDIESSDLSKGIVRFKRKWLTLEQIYKLTEENDYLTNRSAIKEYRDGKLVAIANLMDIVRYFNGDWNYNVTKEEDIGYVIVYDGSIKAPNYSIRRIEACSNIYYGNIIFKNEADAQYVIDNPNFKDVLDNIFKS